MKRLWLRFWLWWNNICPEHGEMLYDMGGYYCVECNIKWRERRANVCEVRRRKYQEMTKSEESKNA